LRIVTLGLVTVLTAGIGAFATYHNYDLERVKIDSKITETIADAAALPNQELSAALFHADEYSLDLTVALISRDATVTIVKESTTDLFEEISLRDVERAVDRIRAGRGLTDFRYQALPISGGDFLLVAASAKDAVTNLKEDLLIVLAITAVASLIAFALLSLYIRRLKRRDDAEALVRMQEFLGDASHELRTPLTVIKGYVEMLSKGQISAPEDQARAFNRVTGEIGRMETLIRDLLLLAELGESAEGEMEEIELSEILKAHADDFATLHPDRNVAVDIARDVKIVGLREYISRFIQNALNNIDRHTDAGVPVRISLIQKGRSIVLEIADGGKGLPESAYREKVRSLNRFDKSRSRESGGSGLGMSIMAAVVGKLRGELRLQKSDLGGLAVIAEFSHPSRSHR
jgi:K+-sensing histidine kinase KdpD